MTATCPSCAATQRCENAPTRGYVCEGHFARLGAILREIEDEAAILSAVPSMQRQHGRSGSLASHRTPVRLDVVVHNDPRHGTGKSEDDDDELAAGETLSILGTLHSWARVIREERNLSTATPVTISGERDLLTRNLDHACAQPWCDEFYSDVNTLASQLKAANGHRPEQPYSRCPVIAVGEPCTGDIWIQDELQPVWRRYTDRCAQTWERAPGAAVCDTCNATWTTPAEKARLHQMVDALNAELTRPRTDDGRRMLTAQEIADRLGKSINAVRIIASRECVTPVVGHYDPQAFGLASDVA